MSILDNNQGGGGGDKRTIIAVVLSVIIITVGFSIQGIFFPASKEEPKPATPVAEPQAQQPAAVPSAPAQQIVAAGGASAQAAAQAPAPVKPVQQLAAPVAAPQVERTYTVSTDLIEATFTNKGGDLLSLKLKKFKDKNGNVDLIVPDANGSRGLAVGFGGPDATPISDLMNERMIDPHTIEFSRTYLAMVPGQTAPVPFTYRKTFTFKNGEYLFGMTIDLENSVNQYLPLDQNGAAYTVFFRPQIGPTLDESAGKSNGDYRKFIALVDGKRREEKFKAGVPYQVKNQPSWVALSGKYFTFVSIPELSDFSTTLLTAPDKQIVQRDEISITRPVIKTSVRSDSFYFYFGPKTNAALGRYDYADQNAFHKADMKLEDATDGAGVLTWLENILKFLLNIFYRLIPNYGIAIILVTILVKAILFPLTRKGSVSAARMQELQPKMAEIQAKYKGNPQKLNQELAEFYKREGYNPMSGCLPLLIQFPIFIAMYNLFNNHFDLRGAMFIPGWIPDLSQPEAILSFPTIDLVIWHINALRLLPLIYLGSQLLYGKYTQMNAGAQSPSQMKIMMYGMPILFFFILYDVPAGLLIYWIVSNLLSIVQQIVINDILKKRKAVAAAAVRDSRPKIVPKRKK